MLLWAQRRTNVVYNLPTGPTGRARRVPIASSQLQFQLTSAPLKRAPPPRAPSRVASTAPNTRSRPQTQRSQATIVARHLNQLEPHKGDVIDLGAPRRPPSTPRTRRVLQPNPRLYPGKPKKTSKSKKRRSSSASGGVVRRRRKRAFKRPVPNSRLYRPGPPRPRQPPAAPPPRQPTAHWPPPLPALRPLETASRVALRLSVSRPSPAPALGRATHPPPRRTRGPPLRHSTYPRRLAASPANIRNDQFQVDNSVWPSTVFQEPVESSVPRSAGDSGASRLVVTLPGAPPPGAWPGAPPLDTWSCAPPRYHSLDTDSGESTLAPPSPRPAQPTAQASVATVAVTRVNTAVSAATMQQRPPSPDRSDADPKSAPSEYLAEFLSAIMQRQYAEALKFCRLILQYEPRNATARGFYPLLQQKLSRAAAAAAPRRAKPPRAHAAPDLAPDPTAQQGEVTPNSSENASEACAWRASQSEPGSPGSLGSDSAGSCASLSLDSSGANASPLATRARDFSPADLDQTPSTSSGALSGGSGASASASDRWQRSGGSRGSGGSDGSDLRSSRGSTDRTDLNGNPWLPTTTTTTTTHTHAHDVTSGDVENDNAAGAGGDHTPTIKSAAASLLALRAQFTHAPPPAAAAAPAPP